MDSNPPTALQRLWAPAERGERAPRAGISLPRIVATATELADEGGLDAVSLTRVAERLDHTTMSLYRYVANKDELLLFMHDAAWRVPESLDRPFGAWRDGLTAWCQEQRATLRRHPWLERIRVTERVGTPNQLTWIDRGLRFLASTPLTEYEKTQLLFLLNGQIFWDARVVADLEVAVRGGGAGRDQAAVAMHGMIQAMSDAGRFPFLSQSVAAGAFAPVRGWQAGELASKSDAEFRFGLGIVLDGVEAVIARRTAGATGPTGPTGPDLRAVTALPG